MSDKQRLKNMHTILLEPVKYKQRTIDSEHESLSIKNFDFIWDKVIVNLAKNCGGMDGGHYSYETISSILPEISSSIDVIQSIICEK